MNEWNRLGCYFLLLLLAAKCTIWTYHNAPCRNLNFFETVTIWLYFPLFLIDYLLPASQPFHHMYWKVEYVVYRFLFDLDSDSWLYSNHKSKHLCSLCSAVTASENKVETELRIPSLPTHVPIFCLSFISRLGFCVLPYQMGSFTSALNSISSPFQPSDYVFSVAPNRIDRSLLKLSS